MYRARIRDCLVIVAAVLLTLGTARQSVAAPVQAIDFTSVNTNFTNGTWSLGFRFTVGNTAIFATHLGFYDDLLNGLSQTHDVGIFTDTGVLLASTTVTNGDPLTGFFRYHDIPDLLLAANTSYRIAGVTGQENYTWQPNGFTVDPLITFDGDRWISSATLVFPTNNDIGIGYFGPNFLLQAVPEPATLAVFGMVGLAGVGYAWRRRRALS